MSRAPVDISVLPIDVGFDLRAHDMPIGVQPGTRSAAYDDAGEERTIVGTTAEVVAALEAAGYTCVTVVDTEVR